MDLQEIIRRGLRDSGSRQAKCSKLGRYYVGDHDLAFATQKFRNFLGNLFHTCSDNLVPAVMNGFADNLGIENFMVEEGDTKVSDAARRIRQANFMEQGAGDVHREFVLSGDTYVIVSVDSKGGPTIYPNRSSEFTVIYDNEMPGQINAAMKVWAAAARRTRPNVFLPDRIEKYEAAAVV
jgi:hypothetical protein